VRAHKTAVVGICSDKMGRSIITAGKDKQLMFWNFKSMKRVKNTTVTLEHAVSKMELHSPSGLLALALDNFDVQLRDLHNVEQRMKLVRKFGGQRSAVTDMCFTPDGRWLLIACADCTIRVFDLMNSRLIEWMRFSSPVTSLSFSPKNEFLATTHTGRLGVYLWANKNHFGSVLPGPVPTVPSDMERIEHAYEEDDDAKDADMDASLFDDVSLKALHYSRSELTTTERLRSAWANLLYWEEMQKRNAPVKPLEKPKAAPFFLPTTLNEGEEFEFDTKAYVESLEPEAKRRRIGATDFSITCTLVSLLSAGEDPEAAHKKAVEYLFNLGPSAVDNELRSVGTDPSRQEVELGLVADFFTKEIAGNRNFDMLQAYLNTFLRIHMESLMSHKGLLEKLKNLRATTKGRWARLEKVFHANLCLTKFLSGLQL